MKTSLVVLCAVCSFVLLAHSPSECYKYVDEVVAMISLSPEWDDCPDESDTNEVEVLFPTMTSVFASEMPSNSCAFGWTAEERCRAFDDFLVGLSQTNRILVSESFIRTGAYAFICCGEKGYTNVVNIAQNLVLSGEAPCKDSALEYLLRTAVPSDEMTAVILSVQSNKFDFAKDMQNRAVSTYVESLRSMSVPVSSVVTNAARAMYENRGTIDHLRAVDLLMLRVWPDYVSSSNRLVVAELAIAQTLGDERPEGALVRNYFAPVTNQLMKSAQPLPEVDALRGL